MGGKNKRLTQQQIELMNQLVENFKNTGNTPDWDQISETVGKQCNQKLYDKINGKYNWTENQKLTLRELYIENCDNFEMKVFLEALKPHKAYQIRQEIKHMCSKDQSLKPFSEVFEIDSDKNMFKAAQI